MAITRDLFGKLMLQVDENARNAAKIRGDQVLQEQKDKQALALQEFLHGKKTADTTEIVEPARQEPIYSQEMPADAPGIAQVSDMQTGVRDIPAVTKVIPGQYQPGAMALDKQYQDLARQKRQDELATRAQEYTEQQRKQGVRSTISFSPEGGVSVTHSEQDPIGKQIAKGLQDANITGYDVAEPSRVIPSTKDAEEIKKASALVKQSQNILPGAAEQLKDSSWYDRFGAMKVGPITIGTEKGRLLEQKATDLLSIGQKLLDTGVLQPGELPVLKSRIGELTGLAAMGRDPADITKQLAAIEKDLIDRTTASATARGYKPRAGYLDPSQKLQSYLKPGKKEPAGKTVVKQLRNKSTGQVKTIYSDGSEEVQ
jgi:hypothetical protein